METYRERKRRVSHAYAEAYGDDRCRLIGDQALNACISFLADAPHGGRAILDLGCGAGDLLCSFGALLGEEACCVGVDLSQEMLAVAQEKIKDCPQTYVIRTDVTQPLPFPDDTFDLVASLNLLEEVSAPMVVLEEVHRTLKPGGSFRGIAACYAGGNAAEIVHQAIARRYTWYFLPADELLALFHGIFPTGTGHFELFPRPLHRQASAWPGFNLFADTIRKVQELGHNPEDVRLGCLVLEGKKA